MKSDQFYGKMLTCGQSAFPCINKTDRLNLDSCVNFNITRCKSSSRNKIGRGSSTFRKSTTFTTLEMYPHPRCLRLPRNSVWSISLILCLAFSSCLLGLAASPIRQPSICGPSVCKAELDVKDTEMKFHYKGGSIYSYQYVVNGTTSVQGGPPTQSGLHLSAKVTIRFLTACDAILFMKDVDVWQSYLSEEAKTQDANFRQPKNRLTFIKSLEQFSLRFSYGDGLIEEICPHSEESSWALNIKRGFLSAFQNTMRRLDLEHKGYEDDVHGKCKVEYQLGTATSSALTIDKIKDLKSCGDKYGILSSIQGTPYNFGTLHQSMPAVMSSSECEHIVDRNLLSKVRCSETHRLRSLARGVSGAYMSIRQNLELVSVYVPPLLPSFGSRNDSSYSSGGLSPFEEEDDRGDDYGDGTTGDEDRETKNKQKTGQVEEQAGNSAWIITRNPDAYISSLINKASESISRREALLFRHDYNLGHGQHDYNSAKNALLNFCSSIKTEVGSKSGEFFESLVHTLRGLSSKDMNNLSKDATQICQGDRDPFDDALEAVGTAASIEVIQNRILKSDSSPKRIRSWVNSLSFIPKPDLALLSAAVPILRARDNYPNILLSYSSLAHSYCNEVGHQACIKEQPISILMKLYEKYFNATGCLAKTRKGVDQALMYLKGIGNFGLYSNGIVHVLSTCIMKNDKAEIRVTAIDAYRRMPCQKDGDIPILRRLFEDQLEDSEIRIVAFIALMRCPTYPSIRWILETLEKEQANQVGSFVWTYLTNLQETALPSKGELQGLLADEKLSSKFSTDIRKFSRNFEISTFHEEANLGVGLDGNLIFSQNSYLPRSASVNLTVDLFGESVNVLEGTMRVESFEAYVESIFGPSGKPHASLSKSNLNSSSGAGKRRERRGAPSKRKMRTLALEYDALKRYHADPIASLSLKTFGNEIFYQRMVGIPEQIRAMGAINPFKIFDSMTNQKDTNWQKSRLLLDSSYIIPTGVGFPLNLSAQASSIMRFETESLIDSSAKSAGLKLKGKFIPSVILTVVGSMTLSASDIHTGLKVRAHLKSSTAVEGVFHVEGTNLLDVEFGLPKKQLELLEYRSDLLFMDGEEFHSPVVSRSEEEGPEQNPICTGGLFYKYGGLKLCSSSHFSLEPPLVGRGGGVTKADAKDAAEEEDYETDEQSRADYSLAPYFPLNGPSYFILTLDKANPSLLKTRFHYVWNNNQTNSQITLTGTTLTGESTDSAKEDCLGLNFELDKENQNFDLELKSVARSFKASGQLKKDWSSGDLDVNLKQNQSPVFATSASFKAIVQSSRKTLLKPVLTVQRNNRDLLVVKGDFEIVKSSDASAQKLLSGHGEADYGGRKMDLTLDGGFNETSVTLNWVGDYSAGERIKCTSRLTTLGKHNSRDKPNNINNIISTVLKEGIDSQLSLEFSEFPQYNLAASWKYQASDDGFDHECEFCQGPRYSQKGRDPSNLWIRAGGLNQRGHEGSRHKWLFLVSHPSEKIDVGFQGSLNTHGKSLDSAINLRYAPGKNLDTSLSLKRAPGVLTFVQFGWNITLHNQNPLQFSFHLEEKAHRVYQAQLNTDWSRDKLQLDVEYSDRSKRSRLDTSVSLGITTTAINNLKLGFHIASEEKASKIRLSSEYKSQLNTFELGYGLVGREGRKHKLYGSLTSGDTVYLVMSEIDLEHGLQCIIKTELGQKFSDIYARVRGTNQNGMQILALEYRWDASRDTDKQFLLECFIDMPREHLRRTSALLSFPGYHYFLAGEYTFNEDERTGSVSGKVSWKKDEEGGHLHLNGRLGPRSSPSDDHEAYDASLQLATPFTQLKNVSFNLGLDFLEERSVCQINFDGSWGDDQTTSGTLLSKLQALSPEEQGKAREDEIDNLEELDEENEISTTKSNLENKFKFSLEGNMTSTVRNFQVVNLKLNHIHHSYLNLKTDVDIQLPNEKEISLSSHWVVPQSLSDLLSTRAELHIKTPFVGYQNVDLQGILGRKEDRDVLALIGIYVENFQYAISITGTPRFEEDGALGFDVTTSNPKYDKIFGSFSYLIGDNTRLACQLGWPQVVIGLETGWEWTEWEDFKVYYTFTSPWMPMKNINALAKIDGAQLAELKLEMNEDSMNAKCEWVIVTWKSLDIRLDGNSPFEEARKFGFIVKNSWEDDVTYHSQITGWVNDQQVGYKLEGGQSEVEEEVVVAHVMNSQLEIDTIVYPTIRGLFNLAQREERFNLAASLTLREGPINIEGQLDLLDVFRFNENVTITTPYPGLFELEINLSPAFFPEKDLYNLGLQSKWRSGSEWHEGGLVVRLGPQQVMVDILTTEAEDNNYPISGEQPQEIKITIPMSQLFYFHSPLSWAKVVKLEYEPLVLSTSANEDDQEGGEDQDEESTVTTEDQIPIRNFAIVYSSDIADFSTGLHNEKLTKKLTGSMDIRMSDDTRRSFKVDGLLDLSEPEKKFNILTASYHPSVREYSVGSTWTNELPQYLQGKIELKSPLDNWEEQSGTVMYAHNEGDSTYSADVELISLAFEKLATNVVVGPKHFSMTLNTPLQGFEEMEIRGDTNSKDDDDSSDILNTLIVVKCAEKDLEIDVDSTIDPKGWPTEIKGTISTTFGLEAYHRGDLKADVEKTETGVNANGEIEWKNNQRLRATLLLSFPASRFHELNLTVDTPFKDREHWELWLLHQPTDNQFGVQLRAKTPFTPFEVLEADGTLEIGSSILEVKKAILKAKAPVGTMSTNSSWTFELANMFGLSFDSKYALTMDSATRTKLQLPVWFPNENGLKLKIRNFIPTLKTLTTIDSRAYLESVKPSYRLGAGITAELIEGESLAMKLTSKYMKSSYVADLSSKFDQDLINGEAKLDINATGDRSNNYRSSVQWRRVEDNSLDGEGQIEWGADGRLLSSVQSTFNCSWPDDNDVQLHLTVGYPSIDTNTTDSPLISIDGFFNQISKRHSARVQIGQEGMDEKPVVFNVELMAQDSNNFASTVNFTSNFELISDAGAHISNKIDGSVYDGLVSGHWEEDKMYMKYYLDYQNTHDLFKLNVSLDGELPVSTESVPKPQTGSIMALYQFEEDRQAVESEFRGVYQSVQLVNATYRSSSESLAGLEKEEKHLEFENHFWPFGVNSFYQYEYSGGFEGLNLPTKTVRSMEVYDLGQADLHKLEGELQIKTNFTGREITLTGRHPKREEIQLITDYEFSDHRFRHNSRFTLRPESWLGYELDIMNRTNAEKTEHELGFRLTYPIRVITLNSGYKYQDASLNWTTEVNLNASKSDRKLIGVVTYDFKEPNDNSKLRRVGITLKHPSLVQDLRAEGQLQTDGWDLMEGKVWMDYTGDLNNGLMLLVRTQPEFSQEEGRFPYWNVSTDIRLQHSATNLDLKTLHSTQHSAHELSIITLIDFKNSKKSPAQESKIAFELFKQLRKAHIMLSDPKDYFELEGQMTGQHPEYTFMGEANISGIVPLPKARMSLDLLRPYMKMYAVHGKDLTDGVYAEGGVIDSRNVKFDIWESYDNFRFSDVSFFLRMNHSRLITSKLKWRPELFQELKELAEKLVDNASQGVTSKADQLLQALSRDTVDVVLALWEDAKGNVAPFISEIREECDFRNDSAALQFFWEELQNQNDFYVQDILGFTQLFLEEISMRISELMEKLKTYREDVSGESVQMFEKVFLWLADKIKESYNQLVTAWENYQANPWDGPSISFAQIKEKLSLLAYYSIGFVVKLSEKIYESLSSLTSSIAGELNQIVKRYQPGILTLIHQLETIVYDFIVKVSDFIYETKEEVMKSPYYIRVAQLAQDVDALYQDISQNEAATNIKKYYNTTKTFILRKLSEMDDLRVSLGHIGTKIAEAWEKVKEVDWVKVVENTIRDSWSKINWLIEYTNLDETLQELLVLLYTQGNDLFSQTVLQAGARHQTAKTKFIFDSDKGIISLEQKLPMPWAAFNETPDFQKLPEYQTILKVQDLFQSSEGSFWDVYYKVKPDSNLLNWLPPFDGHAMLVGSEYFFTFDGLAYDFSSGGSCVYLLTGDFVDGKFSISVQYNNKSAGQAAGAFHEIIVAAGHNTLVIDMEQNGLKDPKRGQQQILNLPVQMQNLSGYRDGDRLIVESQRGLKVSCNMVYKICQFWVSGWYSRKTAGLLGTMDEEPSTDLILTNGKRAKNVGDMVKSWHLSDDSESGQNCPAYNSKKSAQLPTSQEDQRNSLSKESNSSKIAYTCQKLFRSKMSSLQPCFASVKVDPYLEMCLMSDGDTSESVGPNSGDSSAGTVCTSAVAYVSTCKTTGIRLKVPSICIKCHMNGEEMIDRDMKVISSPPAGSPAFRSTDVVFIVEAKDCNRAIRTRRKIDVLVKSLEEEFERNNFKQNRYAAVLFGGDGVFDKPHPVIQNNEVFTTAQGIGKYLASLPTGNGSLDIFNGIWHTLQRLNYRPGVSKTFILFPCSSCQPQHMTMDFSDLHYALLEQDAKLHILMNDDVDVDDKGLAKKLFGMDSDLAFTKLDGTKNRLKGDANSRRQVKVPRSVLGYCTPLALQTNGTVFNGKKLQNKREDVVQLFTTVFSGRVVQTAQPADCQSCYCSPNDDDGIGRIECFVCGYPRYKSMPEDEDDNEDDFQPSLNNLTSNEPDTEADNDGYEDGNMTEEDDEE